MIGARVVLDTSIAVAVLNRQPAALARYHAEGPMALPAVAAGELLFGAANSGLQRENLERYQAFISGLLFLPVDLDTARAYAELRLALKQAGRPVPENDLWIAATCIRYGLTQVTHDAHFSHCPHLAVEDWLVSSGPGA